MSPLYDHAALKRFALDQQLTNTWNKKEVEIGEYKNTPLATYL